MIIMQNIVFLFWIIYINSIFVFSLIMIHEQLHYNKCRQYGYKCKRKFMSINMKIPINFISMKHLKDIAIAPYLICFTYTLIYCMFYYWFFHTQFIFSLLIVSFPLSNDLYWIVQYIKYWRKDEQKWYNN